MVSVISDDSDVFVLLLHFYVKHNCPFHMYMSSLKGQKIMDLHLIHSTDFTVTSHEECTVIDIKKTTAKHADLSQHILQIHALSGADMIAPNFGIGKKKALNTLMNFIKNEESKRNSSKQKKQPKC